MTASRPRLIYGDSHHCADILYATGLAIPDPFLYCEVRKTRFIVVSPLEHARAKTAVKAGIDVLSFAEARHRFKLRNARIDTLIAGISRHFGIREWRVPHDFPLGLVQKLRRRPISFRCVSGEFFPERRYKTPKEVAMLKHGVELAEAGLNRALAVLAEAKIVDDGIVWNGDSLTVERLRGEINATVSRLGGVANHTIVAPGWMGSEPHNTGSGPIAPHQPIVIDIFPRVTDTGYFGDLTRTVVKGCASDIVKRAFSAVRDARDMAIRRIEDGADAQAIHDAVSAILADAGFDTDLKADPPYGFIHGTGHGVGLEIHEEPRISRCACTLRSGEVVTVEPGVYHVDWGGMRLEDMVVVQRGGCTNLTTVPDQLEIP